MSLGGAIFALSALVHLKFTAELKSRAAKWAVVIATGWIFYSVANLTLRPWDTRTWHTLGNLPLLWVPVAGILIRFKASYLDDRKWAWLLSFISAALAVTAVRSAWQFFVWSMPAIGFMRNPIYLAYNLLPPFVFFAELHAKKRDRAFFKHPWAGVTALLCLAVIFMTLSRMPFTCALGYLAFRWAPALRSKANRKSLGLAALLACAAGVSAYRLSPMVQEKVDRTFAARDTSRDWRLVAWRHNWDLFRASPLLGVGAEKNGIDPARQPEFVGHWEPNHLFFAHDIYLQSLADSGLVGTALFIAFWVLLALAFPGARALIVVMAVAGLTENIFNNSKAAHAVYFYSLLCVLWQRSAHESA